MVADKYTRKLKRGGTTRARRFPLAEDELEKRFRERRSKGRRVSERWIFAMMRQLVKDMYPGVPFMCSRGWLMRCRERLGITVRTKSNCKRLAVSDRVPAVMLWLARYRLMLQTQVTKSMPMDPVWGRFKPELRFNGDQVPSCSIAHTQLTRSSLTAHSYSLVAHLQLTRSSLVAHLQLTRSSLRCVSRFRWRS
jgi:hypothetical protein